MGVTLVVNNVLEKRHIMVPQVAPISTIAVGAVGGALASLRMKSSSFELFEKTSALEFMLVFIAPIIFAEGYGLQQVQFFDNMTRILAHAFAGTVISSVVVAACIYYLPPLVGLPITWQAFSAAECLTFGAMISSTDPVTTLAIFKEQHLVENGRGHLYYSVLGESILNDAVAITLFGSFGGLVEDGSELTANLLLSLSGAFLYKFFASLAIGVVVAIAAAAVLKFARLGSGSSEDEHMSFNVPELGVMLVFAYLPFLVAESLNLSGIVAIMFGGITMRAYAHYNLTAVTRQVFLPTVELVANLLETYVFLLLGVGVILLPQAYSGTIILSYLSSALLGCLLGRACNVYPIALLANVCSSGPKHSLREQHVAWFAGLRGAIAFMCALSFPLPPNGSQTHRHMLLCITIIIVGLTIIGFGWPTAAVLQILGITRNSEEPARETEGHVLSETLGGEVSQRRYQSFIDRRAASLRHILMTSDARMLYSASQVPSPRPSLGLPVNPSLQGQTASLEGPSADSPIRLARTSAPPGLRPPRSMASEAALQGRPSLPARLPTSSVPSGPRRSLRMLVNP